MLQELRTTTARKLKSSQTKTQTHLKKNVLQIYLEFGNNELRRCVKCKCGSLLTTKFSEV